MPRLPNRIQNQPFGSQNNAGKSRQAPPPALLSRGSAQPRQQAIDPTIPAPILRQINTLQSDIQAATAQVKASPGANSQLLQQVALVVGGANGTAPYVTINHGLGQMPTSIQIQGIYGGIATFYSVISYTDTQATIWFENVSPFPGQSQVTADIFIYS